MEVTSKNVPLGCPVCGYTSDNEADIKTHLAEMANDPAHQAYDLDQQEKDDEERETSPTGSSMVDSGEETEDVGDIVDEDDDNDKDDEGEDE